MEEGDVVFVIGNPGQTNRLRTIAQLDFQQSVQVPALIGFLESRLEALGAYRTSHPAEAEALEIRNRMFSLSNSLKASTGRLEALEDPGIMARKRDAERQLEDSLRADADLAARYGGLFDRLEEIQGRRPDTALRSRRSGRKRTSSTPPPPCGERSRPTPCYRHGRRELPRIPWSC